MVKEVHQLTCFLLKPMPDISIIHLTVVSEVASLTECLNFGTNCCVSVVTLETIAVSWRSSSIINKVKWPARGRITLLPIARGVCKKLF